MANREKYARRPSGFGKQYSGPNFYLSAKPSGFRWGKGGEHSSHPVQQQLLLLTVRSVAFAPHSQDRKMPKQV